jgi:hypothetical protein
MGRSPCANFFSPYRIAGRKRGGQLMLRLLSARHGLGGSLRRYQHERLGIIATLATPDAEIIQIVRRHPNRQAIARYWPKSKAEVGCQTVLKGPKRLVDPWIQSGCMENRDVSS